MQRKILLRQNLIQMIKIRNTSMLQENRRFLSILDECFCFIQYMTANLESIGVQMC
jgi:hypothetical protein